jgi:hypothetical protein
MGKKVLVDSRIGNPFSNNWSYLIGFTTYGVAPINLTCHEISFSNYLQMDTHFFYA